MVTHEVKVKRHTDYVPVRIRIYQELLPPLLSAEEFEKVVLLCLFPLNLGLIMFLSDQSRAS